MSQALRTEERRLFENTDPAKRAMAASALAERARRGEAGVVTLLGAATLLEAIPDWNAVLTLTEGALEVDQPDTTRAEWLARRAWCLFWADRTTEAWDVLTDSRGLIDRAATSSTKLRAYLVSGYVMDVRGAHHLALAWYSKALLLADDSMKPHVLLEMGTSESKQGKLAESVTTFDKALSALRSGDPKHDRLRIHLLSRSGVAYENLGDLTEAMDRHDAAVASARTSGNRELEFESLRRRARTLLAAQDFERAKRDLDDAENIAAGARRGELHMTHDWARFHRARGEWREALGRYKACLRLLPDAATMVLTFSDICTEILDGLEECLSRTNTPGEEAVRQARTELSALHRRTDIYSGQALTLDEQRGRIATAVERMRIAVLGDGVMSFVSAGYHFDLERGVARRLDQPGEAVEFDVNQRELLRFLYLAPGRTIAADPLREQLSLVAGSRLTREALRQIVSRLRLRLGIGPHELIGGMQGVPGGGYRLLYS